MSVDNGEAVLDGGRDGGRVWGGEPPATTNPSLGSLAREDRAGPRLGPWAILTSARSAWPFALASNANVPARAWKATRQEEEGPQTLGGSL